MGGKKKKEQEAARNHHRKGADNHSDRHRDRDEPTRESKKEDKQKPIRNEERYTKQQLKKERIRARYQHGDDVWMSEFRKFQEQLGIFDLYIKDVAGDGNCLFRAVCDQILGNPERHAQFRDQCVDFMVANREGFEPFMEDDIPFDRYVVTMRKNGTWGGHLELQAMSLIHNVNITIHQLEQARWEIKNHFGTDARYIHLSYHDGQHWCSVRPKGDINGPPNHTELVARNVPVPKAVPKAPKDPKDEIPTEDELYVIRCTGSSLEISRKTLADFRGDRDSAVEYLVNAAYEESTPVSTPQVENSTSKLDPVEKVEKPMSEILAGIHDLTSLSDAQLHEAMASLDDQLKILQNFDLPETEATLNAVVAQKAGIEEEIQHRIQRQDEELALKMMLEMEMESQRPYVMPPPLDTKPKSKEAPQLKDTTMDVQDEVDDGASDRPNKWHDTRRGVAPGVISLSKNVKTVPSLDQKASQRNLSNKERKRQLQLAKTQKAEAKAKQKAEERVIIDAINGEATSTTPHLDLGALAI